MQTQDRDDGIVSGLRRWHATISSWAGLGRSTRSPAVLPANAEPLRQAMRALAREVAGTSTRRLAYAIETSRDVATLWYLRITLMQALAAAFGERAARERIAGLDGLFLQLWPKAPLTRA
jgi:hypothetical protein